MPHSSLIIFESSWYVSTMLAFLQVIRYAISEIFGIFPEWLFLFSVTSLARHAYPLKHEAKARHVDKSNDNDDDNTCILAQNWMASANIVYFWFYIWFYFFFHVFKTVNFGCFAMFCYEESYFLDLLQVRKANDTHWSYFTKRSA